jgi:hypothetical protein
MSWLYRVISTLVGLVSLRLINDRIGIYGYGDVAFTLAFLGGIVAIDFGFLQSISRFVALYSSTVQSSQRGRFWASCVLFAFGVAVIQTGFLLVALFFLKNIAQFRIFSFMEILGFGMAVIIGNLLSAGSAIYAGLQDYVRASVAKILRPFCYIGIIVFLWRTGELTVKSVICSYALSVILPNLIVGILLFTRQRIDMRPDWKEFPRAHLNQVRDISSYSMHGWMFTASTILITYCSVFFAGFVLPSDKVALLQISLITYTGVAAFVTGGMAPLTTIRARLYDTNSDATKYVSMTVSSLIEDGVLITAILLGFFFYHLDIALVCLLGNRVVTPQFLSVSTQLFAVVILPGLMIMPWFTFRFALVHEAENRRYNIRVFIVTFFALLFGLLSAIPSQNPLPIAISIALALSYRGLLAYKMGHSLLPGLSHLSILRSLFISFILCTALNLFASNLHPTLVNNLLPETYHHAVLYIVASAILYIFRRRFHPLIRLRL